MKNTFIFYGIITFFVIISFTSCSTFNVPVTSENVAEGKLFHAHLTHIDNYDPSMSIKDHSILIVLGGHETSIVSVNGKEVRQNSKINLGRNRLIILKPGEHTLELFYTRGTGRSGNTESYVTAHTFMNFTFEPSQYYFLDYNANLRTGEIQFFIRNFSSFEAIALAPYKVILNDEDFVLIPTETVIKGINSTIKRDIKW